MSEEGRLNHLIDQAQAGDQDSFAQLFEHFRGRLRRMIVLRMDPRIRARFDASDVLQDAFVEISRRLPSLATRELDLPFFLWVRMVTGERLLQLHRVHLAAEKRSANRDVSIDNAAMPDASSVFLASQLAGQFTSVDQRLKREDTRVKLEAALNAMAAADREIIAMRHYEELSTVDIATILGITRSGVSKRYLRAIERLGRAVNTDSDITLP